MKKENRQALIEKLVTEHTFETKKDIVRYLAEHYHVYYTLATISKDLAALGIYKQPGTHQKAYYKKIEPHAYESYRVRLQDYMKHNVLESHVKDAYVLIKTEPGFARAINFYIDQLQIKEIIGTVSGNDMVFILTTSGDMAKYVHYQLLHAHVTRDLGTNV